MYLYVYYCKYGTPEGQNTCALHLIDTQWLSLGQTKPLQQIESNSVQWLKHNVMLFLTHMVIPSRSFRVVVSSPPCSNLGLQPSSILKPCYLVGYLPHLHQNGRNRKSMEWVMWGRFTAQASKWQTYYHLYSTG